MLERYGHHKSVIGVGIDVEWYGAWDDPNEDKRVSDERSPRA